MTRDEYYRTLDAIDEVAAILREGFLDSDVTEGEALGGLLEPLGELRGKVVAFQARFGQV